MAGGESDSGEEEVSVSRTDQKGAGLFLAYALTGAAFGLFLAITSMSLRTTTGGPFRRVVVSGMVLAGAITVAPWLKYPPNPPAVGDPDSVGERERLFVLLIVLAALLLAGLAHLSSRLRAPTGPTTAGSRPSSPWGWRPSPCCSRRCRPRPTRSACRPTWCGSSGSTR